LNDGLCGGRKNRKQDVPSDQFLLNTSEKNGNTEVCFFYVRDMKKECKYEIGV